MIIETNTWHYRWYTFFLRETQTNVPHANLCRYFWTVVVGAPLVWAVLRFAELASLFPPTLWRCISWLLIIALAGAALFGIGFLVFVAFLHPWEALWIVAVLLGFVVALFVFLLALVFVHDRLEGKRVEIPNTVKLGAAYVMAKKRRICPFLTFDSSEEVQT